jgi:hypothetical protein
MSEGFVVVATYNTTTEAEMARGRLESAGIMAVLHSDDAGGMYPQLDLVEGVALLVDPADLESAQDILSPPANATQAESDAAEEDPDEA